MNQKEKSINKNIYNQISKKGQIENDKRLLIKKFGFRNLSYSNLHIESTTSNKNYSKNDYSLSSLKNDIKIKKNLNESSNIKLNTLQNINNATRKQNSKNKNIIKDYQFSSISLTKYSSKKKLINRNNKSMAILPISPILDISGMPDYSLSNIKKIIYNNNESKNINVSTINTGTHNSTNTNQNIYSNKDILEISSKKKLIKKNKSNPKYNNKSGNKNNSSTPNLLINIKKEIVQKKEKPCKIFDNKDLYNKAKNEIDIHNKNKNSNINIKKENTLQNKNNKKQKIYSSSEKLNKSEDKNEKDIKKYNNTGSNDNSEDTKKESHLDFQKIINDKILSNIDKKNIINGIISNNMKINFNNKKNSRNNNNQNNNINEQVTINVENNNKENNINKIEENDEFKYKSTQKISLTNIIDINMKIELKDIIKKDSSCTNNENNNNNTINSGIDNNNYNYNCEEDEKDDIINYNHNNDKINEIKYMDINNENVHNINNINNEEDSSIRTNKNIYKKLCDLNNIKEMSKQEEKEIQGDQDIKSVQTQTTVDKNNNNLLSKFMKQPIYNISPRFITNEASLNTKHNLPNKAFMFINDIEKENKKLPVLDINKLLSLNDKSIYTLLSYSYDNYSSIISINKTVKNKINNTLKNIFKHVIDDFKFKYNTFLNVIDYSFNPKTFIINHKKSHLINLEIKCKIITKEIRKSYEIGCNYISFNKVYDYIWIFDVQKKEDIKLWLCTELDLINNSYKKFTYTSQVSSFCYNDEILLQLNIFSKGNNIEPNSIEWTPPVETPILPNVYEKTIFISSIEFDQLRACEVETQVLFWKYKLPADDKGIINDFKKIFGKYFKIKDICYDISKYYFYKFEMKANKIGLIKQNKFSTFDINIIDNNSNVKNEIQCLYLMNSNYYTKKMDIRLGTNITIYIVDMKR